MSRVSAIVFATCSLGVSMAAADPSAADLETKGVQLAQEGHYSDAIDAFKAADRIQPKASHVCLIALAYTRRELWPQVEVNLAECKRRATIDDPLPDWFATAEAQMTERLAAANVAAVEIVVEPRTAQATVTVTSLAPDESFAPRTIHLPPGRHDIIARAPGYEETQASVEVRDRKPARVVIRMHRPGETAARPWPRRLVLAGSITAGAGVVTYGVMGLAWFELRSAVRTTDRSKYDTWDPPYRFTKYATWALWGTGAGLAVTGYLLHRQHRSETTAVGVVPTQGGGGMVVVGWQR